jgi:hypothetical protein
LAAVNEPTDPASGLRSRSGLTMLLAGVSTFCSEHGISRKSFYELRKRAMADGPAAVLEPRTRLHGEILLEHAQHPA